MTTVRRAATFPDCVPILVDPAAGVTLRAHGEPDLPAIVEQANDPASKRWTDVPDPPEGYSIHDARDFALRVVPHGWQQGTSLRWAIEAERDERLQFCGSIGLELSSGRTACASADRRVWMAP